MELSIMMSVISKIFGWKESTFDIYKLTYEKFGGGVNNHPDIIEYLIKEGGCKIKFYHYSKNDKIEGAYFKNEKGKIGVDVWRKYPRTYDEIILPLNEDEKFIIPAKSNRLSPINRKSIYNISFSKISKNEVCLAKDNFTKKTQKTRRNEFNKFISHGGSVKNASDFTPNELADIYIYLFNKRFENNVKCYEKQVLVDIITRFNHMIYGHVLFVNGTSPCAYDLILKAECQNWIYFDVPNGGVDPDFAHLSPGSILMWLNITHAQNLCKEKNKKMHFSIGLYKPAWDYKLRWCERTKLGKVFFM